MSKIVVRSVLVGIEQAMVGRVNSLKKAHWELTDEGKYAESEVANAQERADVFVQGYAQAVAELQNFLVTLFDDEKALDDMDAMAADLTAQPLGSDGFPTGAYL